MFASLTQKFSSIISSIKNYGRLTEDHITQALRDVRLALLEADVNVMVVKSFLEKIKERAVGQKIIESLNGTEQFLKIVYEELVSVLGGAAQTLPLMGASPHVILLCGLQGSGKTTTAGKLALHFKKKGRHPFLVPADLARPAAIEQLKVLATEVDVPCYENKGAGVLDIAKSVIAETKNAHADIAIVDTAGRLHIDEALMGELSGIKKFLPQALTLLVIDISLGQEALRMAKTFHEAVGVDGLVITKLDGDARGGAVFSIQQVLGVPVYFSGTGEKLEALELFDPQRLVDRLLDRGDLLALVEKASEVIDVQEAQELAKKLKKNRFTIEDFRRQLKQVKKMGSLQSMIGMLPGASSLMKKIDPNVAEKDLVVKEAIINSMTLKEREAPNILNGSRRLRIAKGSGTTVTQVNRFLKEFEGIQKMYKLFASGKNKGMKGLLGM